MSSLSVSVALSRRSERENGRKQRRLPRGCPYVVVFPPCFVPPSSLSLPLSRASSACCPATARVSLSAVAACGPARKPCAGGSLLAPRVLLVPPPYLSPLFSSSPFRPPAPLLSLARATATATARQPEPSTRCGGMYIIISIEKAGVSRGLAPKSANSQKRKKNQNKQTP